MSAADSAARLPAAPIEDIIRRGRRRLTVRWAGGVLVASVLLVTMVLGVGALVSSFGGGRARGPASGDDRQTDGQTDGYVLSDLQVEYPYADDEGPDSSKAAVSFLATWTGKSFPGVSQCAIELRDTQGKVVGRQDFTASYAENGVRVTPPGD